MKKQNKTPMTRKQLATKKSINIINSLVESGVEGNWPKMSVYSKAARIRRSTSGNKKSS